MNLETLAQNFKKLLLPGLLLVGTVVFTIVGVINTLTLLAPTPPPPLEFETGENVSQTPFYNLTFGREKLTSLKAEPRVYPATFGVQKDNLASIASQLGFTSPPVVQKEETIFRDNNSRLAFNADTNLISYNSLNTGSLPVGFRDEKQLRAQAQQVVESLKLSNLKMRVNQITYLKSQLENLGEGSLPAAEGQIATLSFQWEKDGQLLLNRNSISFDNKGTLLNFVLYPVTVYDGGKKHPRKDFAEIAKEASSGKFHITYLEQGDENLNLAEPLSLATFDQVGLGLVGQPQNKTVQTVYFLSGSGVIDGQALKVEAVTSAIKGVGVKK